MPRTWQNLLAALVLLAGVLSTNVTLGQATVEGGKPLRYRVSDSGKPVDWSTGVYELLAGRQHRQR